MIKLTPILLVGFIWLMIILTSSSLAREQYWADLISSVTPHLVLIACGISLLVIFYRTKIGLTLLLVSFGLAWLKLPLLSSTDVPSQPTMRVFQFNLNYYNPNIRNVYQTLSTKKSDLTVLFEVNDTNRAEFIALRDAYFDYGSDEHEGFPDGIGIISKYPILYRHKHAIFKNSVRGVIIELVIAVGDKKMRILALHPPSPRTRTLWHKRNMMLLHLSNLLVEQTDIEHTLVIGDFNTHPQSVHFPKPFNYSSCYELSGHYASWAPITIPYTLSSVLGISIDHCLVSDTLTLHNFATLPFQGSDHIALMYEVSFNNE